AAAQAVSDPERAIQVGIGVNAGESVAAAEGYVGSAVNIAARVCALAKAGEVVVTDTVRGLTRTSGRLQFVPLGKRHLKGITEPIALFRAEPAGASIMAAGGRRPIWRRPVVLAGAGGVLALGILTVAAVSGVFGPGGPAGSASPSAPVAESLELIAYTQVGSTDVLAASCTRAPDERMYLIDLGDGASVPMTQGALAGENHPSWSPDGTRLAFVAQSSVDITLKLLDVASGEVTRVLPDTPPAGIDPYAAIDGVSWSAAGTELVFTWDGQVWAVGSDGTSLRLLLVRTPYPSVAAAGTPVWLSDGTIAVILDDGVGGRRLATAPAAGGELTPVPWLPANITVAAAAWSSDRSQVAVVTALPTDTEDGQPRIRQDLYLANANGSNLRASVHFILGDPAWSPDGSQIVFGSGSLFVLDLASGAVRNLPTPKDRAACAPSWGATTAAALPQPTPTPPVVPGATPAPLAFHPGPLDRGVYTTNVFQPRMRFELPAGWVGGVEQPAVLEVHPVPQGPTIGDVQEGIHVFIAQVVYDGPCLDSPTRDLGGDPHDLIAYLQENANLTTSDVVPATVAGIEGSSIDMHVTRVPSEIECPGSGGVVELLKFTDYDFHLNENPTVRVISIQVNGIPVSFFVTSNPDGMFQVDARRILDGLTFP
ncbi:MAG: hypothetical protein ABJA74_17100, partial [Lapillicoccus sp.]